MGIDALLGGGQLLWSKFSWFLLIVPGSFLDIFCLVCCCLLEVLYDLFNFIRFNYRCLFFGGGRILFALGRGGWALFMFSCILWCNFLLKILGNEDFLHSQDFLINYWCFFVLIAYKNGIFFRLWRFAYIQALGGIVLGGYWGYFFWFHFVGFFLYVDFLYI